MKESCLDKIRKLVNKLSNPHPKKVTPTCIGLPPPKICEQPNPHLLKFFWKPPTPLKLDGVRTHRSGFLYYLDWFSVPESLIQYRSPDRHVPFLWGGILELGVQQS